MSNKKQPEEQPKEQSKEQNMRQIVIETDGNNINIVKAEIAGNLELIAILQSIIQKISKSN